MIGPMRRLALGSLIVIGSFAVFGATTVQAWDEPICIPSTGEVRPPGSFGSHEDYDKFLRDNPGSFAMGEGDTCKKPTPTPSPTPAITPSPTVAATSVPLVGTTLPPALQATSPSSSSASTQQQPGQKCVKESYADGTSHWVIRNTHHGDTRLTREEGEDWPLEKDLCAQDAEVTLGTTTPTKMPSIPTSETVAAPLPTPSPLTSIPAPSVAPTLPTALLACVETSNLYPLTDEAGAQVARDGLPLWYDAEGIVWFGESCSPPPPVILIPEALPNTGDGSTAN